jgi:V/A-type H+-transporting ATPase subunit D
MEMQRLKKLLRTAARGHKLLKDKLDELMKRFLETAGEAKRLRIEAENSLKRAYKSFALASAVMGPALVGEALMIPTRSVRLHASQRNVMGVIVPEFAFTVAGEGSAPYGFAFTSGEMDLAAEAFDEAAPTLLALAQAEKTAQLMALEIEKTRRRVNALENILIPDYQRTIRYIAMKLEENDRGGKTRLMKVKDMILAAKTRAN